MRQHEGNKHHAKKEKRIIGGIPEEEPDKVPPAPEATRRVGEVEPQAKAQVVRGQRRDVRRA